ncbi:MAG TPA: ATP-binding protein, partial [Cyclobacteriaceae bacterium]|nr:ATP-binding protein [Cyclobacteriaceae bacterium]
NGDFLRDESVEIPKEENTEYEKYSSLLRILQCQEEFWLDSDGIIVSSNLEAVNITGYEEYEVLGRHISFFYLKEEKDKAETDLAKAENFGQTFVTGLRVKKRGAPFWAKMRINRIDSDLPKKPRFKVVLQDTTHRALSNLRVRTIKDEYLAIFNNPFIGSFKFNADNYRILLCNQKFQEITGMTKDSLFSFSSFFKCPRQFEYFISLLKKEKKVEGYKILIKDGKSEDNWAVISARYFASKGFAEGILFDISEQHTQMLELQRVNTELDNFTYHASHDLRAPIATILGLVNLGTKETSLEGIYGYLEMIRGRVNHLDNILNDLKAVSFNNSSDLAMEAFDFRNELNAILESLNDPHHLFQIDVDINQSVDFITDHTRMRTVLRNLLANSFKSYNPSNSVSFIKLKIRVERSHASFQLKDNGTGMEWIHKGRIYDMFFRGTTQSTGTGLGLYIVKSMVEKLKGNISFESTLYKGSTFLMSIPNTIMKTDATVA